MSAADALRRRVLGPRAKQLHTLRDAGREARRLGMPFGRIHDPIGEGAIRCLRGVCERTGLEWTACRAALGDPALRARVDASTAALAALGHWGVPVTVFGGELFWGQDRLEDLEVALRDAGAERHA